jgi:HlyD family secretion protein
MREKTKNIFRNKVFLTVMGLSLVVTLSFLVVNSKINTSVKYQFATLQKGNIESIISSSGTLNPVTEVVVGTQVSGTIEKIYVDFNDNVIKGQIIAVLDSSLLRMFVDEARAGVLKAEAQLEEAQTNYARSELLSDKALLSLSDFQSVKTTLKNAQAGMISAQTALQRAEKNLNYAIIRAPISGTVTARNVEAGQTVAASFSTPTLFTIAQDMSKMEIKASVDESDIGQIKQGQAVRFAVQAYPERKFEGTVKQVRVQPTTTANVVNYTVIISAGNRENLLLPGMTATVDFIVEHKTDVLTVPNAALRFQPDGRELAEIQQRMQSSMPPPPTDSLIHNMQQWPPPPYGSEHEWKRIWYLDHDGKLNSAPVQAGISDGTNTELLGGHCSSGMKVIIGTETVTANTSSSKSKPNSGGPPPPMM